MKIMAIAAPGSPRCGIKDYSDLLREHLKNDWHLVEIPLPDTTKSQDWQDAAARANSADLVLVHYEYGLFHSIKPYRNIFARFMKRLRSPAIVILHDLLPELKPRWANHHSYQLPDMLRDLFYLPFFATWSSRIYGLADHYIVHAPQLYDQARPMTSHSSISFLHHPIPRASARWQIDKLKQYTFISPGFIKPHKGYLDFLEVVNCRKHWSWLLAGGPQTEKDRDFATLLDARINSLGLHKRVTISGYLPREAMENIMTQAELAVFPYNWAAGSGAVAWALALGMPILATDRDSFRALALDKAGLALLPAGKPEQWPDIVDAILSGCERKEKLANLNRAFSFRHSYDETARHISAIGSGLLPHRKTREEGT